MAKSCRAAGRNDRARAYLRKIVDKYPDTEWAKEVFDTLPG